MDGALYVCAQIGIGRLRWIGEIRKIQECRVRISWAPTAQADARRAVAGGWANDLPSSFVRERTLSEGNPGLMVPLCLVLERSDQLRRRAPLVPGRVYVVDGLLMAAAPLKMLSALEPGTYWLSVELLSGAKWRRTFSWLLSIDDSARQLTLEPKTSDLDTVVGLPRVIITRPADAPVTTTAEPRF